MFVSSYWWSSLDSSLIVILKESITPIGIIITEYDLVHNELLSSPFTKF